MDIEEKLIESGYKLLSPTKKEDKLILEIIKSKNERYLKSIPFLIYKYDLNINDIYEKTKEKLLFGAIVNITKRIFEEKGIIKSLPNYPHNLIEDNLNYEEFRNEFEMQIYKPDMIVDKQKIIEERKIQIWLSKLFTKKEKQIIINVLNEAPISKTDYEYYSRKTKKKLEAIFGLRDFAGIIYSKKPERLWG